MLTFGPFSDGREACADTSIGRNQKEALAQQAAKANPRTRASLSIGKISPLRNFWGKTPWSTFGKLSPLPIILEAQCGRQVAYKPVA